MLFWHESSFLTTQPEGKFMETSTVFISMVSLGFIILLLVLLSRKSLRIQSLKQTVWDLQKSLEREKAWIKKMEKAQTFERQLLRRLTEAALDRGAYTYSPGVFDLMKTIAIRRSRELGYTETVTAIEIFLSLKTTPDEANTMLGEAIFRHFQYPIPEQGNLLVLADEFLKETFEENGFKPTVFIRVMEPLQDENMGRYGFAGSVRACTQSRRFTLVVLSPPNGVGTFFEALVNLSQF